MTTGATVTRSKKRLHNEPISLLATPGHNQDVTVIFSKGNGYPISNRSLR
jgi:hypothetical protein